METKRRDSRRRKAGDWKNRDTQRQGERKRRQNWGVTRGPQQRWVFCVFTCPSEACHLARLRLGAKAQPLRAPSLRETGEFIDPALKNCHTRLGSDEEPGSAGCLPPACPDPRLHASQGNCAVRSNPRLASPLGARLSEIVGLGVVSLSAPASAWAALPPVPGCPSCDQLQGVKRSLAALPSCHTPGLGPAPTVMRVPDIPASGSETHSLGLSQAGLLQFSFVF